MYLQACFNYLAESEMGYVAMIYICATLLTGKKEKPEYPDNKMM